jgi:hypothetical protein
VEYGPCVVYGKGLGDGFASFLNGEFLRKWRELLYEETKSNIKKCVNVVELIVNFYFYTFSVNVLLSH